MPRRPEQALTDALAALCAHARRRHDDRAVALCDLLLAEVRHWAADVARDCAEAEKRLAALQETVGARH